MLYPLPLPEHLDDLVQLELATSRFHLSITRQSWFAKQVGLLILEFSLRAPLFRLQNGFGPSQLLIFVCKSSKQDFHATMGPASVHCFSASPTTMWKQRTGVLKVIFHLFPNSKLLFRRTLHKAINFWRLAKSLVILCAIVFVLLFAIITSKLKSVEISPDRKTRDSRDKVWLFTSGAISLVFVPCVNTMRAEQSFAVLAVLYVPDN